METLSSAIEAEDKGSSKPTLAEDKGIGPAEIEEAKKAIEDDASLGEGPFDQILGGRRYQVHHAAGKVMGVKQLAEVVGFAEQLGYRSGSTIYGASKMITYIVAQTAGKQMCAATWPVMLASRS